MLCPACDKQMLILEFRDIEIDHCTECGGVWLDHGELELIARAGGEEIAPWQVAAAGKGKRRCPRCNARMRVGPCPGTNIEIDLCPRAHGYWFDRGELQAILTAGGCEGIARKLSEYFGSIFGSEGQGADGGPGVCVSRTPCSLGSGGTSPSKALHQEGRENSRLEGEALPSREGKVRGCADPAPRARSSTGQDGGGKKDEDYDRE